MEVIHEDHPMAATVLFAQAVGAGAESAPFNLTAPTRVQLTGAMNATGAGMAIMSVNTASGKTKVAHLNGPVPSGTLPAGDYTAVRLGPHALGLEKA